MPISRDEYDPVFLHSRREAIVLLITFVVFMAWSITSSYWLGYRQPDGDPVPVLFGMPHWAFWGVFLPWMAANLFTIAYSAYYVANDPLEIDRGDETDDEPSGAEF